MDNKFKVGDLVRLTPAASSKFCKPIFNHNLNLGTVVEFVPRKEDKFPNVDCCAIKWYEYVPLKSIVDMRYWGVEKHELWSCVWLETANRRIEHTHVLLFLI